eukprot:2333625-Amphidinium_carterae.1
MSGSKVKLSGVLREEYFVQALCVTVGTSSACSHAIIFGEPVRLDHGKTMAALLGCTLQFGGIDLCCEARPSVTIHHQVHDRGTASLYRKGLAGHWSERLQVDEDADEGAEHYLLHWFSSLGCCLHDAHNALRWGFQSSFGHDPEVLKKLYTSTSVYKSSLVRLIPGLGLWLQSCLSTRTRDALPDEDSLRTFYACLGVSADLLQLVVEDIVLFYDSEGKQLLVLDTFVETEGFLEILTSTLLSMWRFSKFCASRWTTVGHSCRTVALGCATGFTECFDFLHARKFVSDYEASGAELLDDACKKFCLCIGLAAYLPETFLNHLMQDNRLIKTHSDVEASLSEELCFLEGIPRSVWQMMALHFREDACDLQKHTLDAAHTAYAFLEWRVLSVLHGLPYRLASGDIAQNLEEYRVSKEPGVDDVSLKVYSLLQAKYPIKAIVSGLESLATISWTSYLAEKLHASAAL